MRAPRGCEGAGATRRGQRVQRLASSPPTPASPAASESCYRSHPGPWLREADGLKELRGRPLDHDQWQSRGRGSVFSPVGPAVLGALSTQQVPRMAVELAIYGSGVAK